MSDLDAYKAVGDALYQAKQLPGQTPTKTAPMAKPKKTAKNVAEVKKQKKAVSPTKSRKTAPTPAYNPLAMSDEEFSKITDKQLI
jgi:hypothetical protein